ncbi:helix-turn-helix domain-containing protein [Streptomyces purpureus]|uniref:helix-turn-helix domain-containing protein n=1 Tax=Streptomyces purpureus TaxID=1951 RepID=UPI00037CAC00|nr:helix-turn-helix transcriptional regulator [Streptomyces purpureus]
MPGRKDLDPSSNPRALIGAELRHAREKAGLSQEACGEPLFVSGSYIGAMENGTRRIPLDIAIQLDKLLGTGTFFERNCEASEKSRYPNHFAEAVEAEARATTIKQYVPMMIPGLLQTGRYAKALFRAYRPTAMDTELDEMVDARLERGRLLNDPTTPLLWFVLDEGALQRPVGGPATLAENLRHVARQIRRNRIIVQVLPFSAGAIAAIGGGIKLMYFTDEPALAYIDGVGTGLLLDDPATVARHELTYDLLRASASSPEASLARIEAAAEEYSHGYQQP